MSVQDTRLDQIAALGESRFPDSYAGLVVSCGKVEVYRVPDSGFDAEVRTRFDTTGIVIRDAKYSERYLLALSSQIAADFQYWAGQGIAIGSVGPLSDGSAVQVSTPNADLAHALLPTRYPGQPIAVVDGPAVYQT